MSDSFCCGNPSTCYRTGPCATRAAFLERAKNTDVQVAVIEALHGTSLSKTQIEGIINPYRLNTSEAKVYPSPVCTTDRCEGNRSTCERAEPCAKREEYQRWFTEDDDNNQAAINEATHGTKPQVMPSNPKQKYGDIKVPLHLFPSTAIALGSMAFLEGREKYGQDNFRGSPVEAMTYVRAALSHINLYREGEWTPNDSPEPSMRDSFVPHLGLALACISIIIDAHYAGTLVDNRNYPGGYQKAISEMQPLVQKIRDTHAGKNPKHYTIADTEQEPSV